MGSGNTISPDSPRPSGSPTTSVISYSGNTSSNHFLNSASVSYKSTYVSASVSGSGKPGTRARGSSAAGASAAEAEEDESAPPAPASDAAGADAVFDARLWPFSLSAYSLYVYDEAGSRPSCRYDVSPARGSASFSYGPPSVLYSSLYDVMPPAPEDGSDHDRSAPCAASLSARRSRGGAGLGPFVAPCAASNPDWPAAPACPAPPCAPADPPAAADAAPAALSSVVAAASSEGGPTSGPLIALTLYVYFVSGSRPVWEYALAALPVSATAVSNRPASPALNSILYPVTADPPLEPGSLHVRSIRSCDAAVALALPGLPGGLCAAAAPAAGAPLPDSAVSVIETVSDTSDAPALNFALTANWCSRPVCRSLMV